MKKEFYYFIVTLIFFVMTILLAITVINQKKRLKVLWESQGSAGDQALIINSLLTKTLIIENSEVPDLNLLSENFDTFSIGSLLLNEEMAIVYMARDVCLPCAQRFLGSLEKFKKELDINDIILIIDIENLRQIKLMVSRFSTFKRLYFSQELLLPDELYIDKPVLFSLKRDMYPGKVLIFDDFLDSTLIEWLSLYKEKSRNFRASDN